MSWWPHLHTTDIYLKEMSPWIININLTFIQKALKLVYIYSSTRTQSHLCTATFLYIYNKANLYLIEMNDKGTDKYELKFVDEGKIALFWALFVYKFGLVFVCGGMTLVKFPLVSRPRPLLHNIIHDTSAFFSQSRYYV